MTDITVRTLIAVDESLLEELKNALIDCRKEMAKGADREEALRKEVAEHKPMTEDEAAAYLGRDLDTLRYYRTLGLESFKKGQGRWYTKAIINEWLESGRVRQRNK